MRPRVGPSEQGARARGQGCNGTPSPVVLAVDPGRSKCGLAVCAPGQVLFRKVVLRQDFPAVAREVARRFAVAVAVVGDATGSREALRELEPLGIPVVVVPEAGTSLAARERYFRDHPPKGLWRLVPPGLRTPPEPYDDYVAVLLAERFLESRDRNRIGLTGAGRAP